MANIPIYGRLVNDTDGVIAQADQILDPRTGKMLTEVLTEIGNGSGGESGGNTGNANFVEITSDDITAIANNILSKVASK